LTNIIDRIPSWKLFIKNEKEKKSLSIENEKAAQKGKQ